MQKAWFKVVPNTKILTHMNWCMNVTPFSFYSYFIYLAII
jgi:hypothetical protein